MLSLRDPYFQISRLNFIIFHFFFRRAEFIVSVISLFQTKSVIWIFLLKNNPDEYGIYLRILLHAIHYLLLHTIHYNTSEMIVFYQSL